MQDITTVVIDQEQVEEFLAEASGAYALSIGYADSTGEYDALMETWQSGPHQQA